MQRIVSDLHLFDGASRVRHLAQLEPLLEGVDELVINGDSCDTQVCASPEQVETMQRFFRERVGKVTFITGNHDPDISVTHEVTLAEGRVWVTHGDVFFDHATPWSRLLPEIQRRITAAQAADPAADFDRLEDRWRIHRAICVGLPIEWDLRRRDLPARLRRLIGDLGSPRRIWAMLQAWRSSANRAARWAERQREHAQVVVFGHIHLPFVTRQATRTVVNTGAYAGPFARLAVDVSAEEVLVRPVEFQRGGFRAGPPRTTIPLAPNPTVRISNLR